MRSVFGWSAVALAFLVASDTASAQVVGTFRWQLTPNCNVLTLTVEQRGPNTFGLSGFDDLCGATHAAPATGTAYLNGDATVSLAVTTTRSDGTTISTSALVSLATIGGAWSDNYGNAGTLAFSPTSPAAGEPRHLTLTGPVSVEFAAIANGQVGSSPFSLGRTAPLALTTALVPSGAANANCPGTFAAPKALPGFLCVYQGAKSGVVTGFDVSQYFNNGLTYGGRVTVVANIGGAVMLASWAATIP